MRTERQTRRHASRVPIQAFLCKLRRVESEERRGKRLILMKFSRKLFRSRLEV